MVVENVGGCWTHWLTCHVARLAGHHLVSYRLGQVSGAPPWPCKYPPTDKSWHTHTPHFGDSTCKALFLSVVVRRSLVRRVVRLWGPEGLLACWEPSSLLQCWSSARILQAPIGFLSSSLLECGGFAGIPTIFPRSGQFANHSRLSNLFSYVICAFTYHMGESDIVLLYIRSRVWGIIYVVGHGVATVQTRWRLSLWRTAAEGPNHSYRWGVGSIVYSCNAPGHRDCCGTRRSDSPVKAS
jgi:hypothetical protein